MDIIKSFTAFYTDLESMKVEDLSSIYSDDVTFIDPIDEHHGINAVENYFSRLLQNAKYCQFVIHSAESADAERFVVEWTMSYTSTRLNKGEPISVDGLTLLEVHNDRITRHRDYYDMGQMIYEHIPIFGGLIKRIKRNIG